MKLLIHKSKPTHPPIAPLVQGTIAAGFPSAADEFLESELDLNEYLIKHPVATFYVRVSGESMQGLGIDDGDILVVDKAENPRKNSIVIAVIDGEFTVKKLDIRGGDYYLIPANPKYQPVKVDPSSDFKIWGVVTYTIKKC